MVEKQGQKIRAGVSPPPFRAMPKRKHFFFREGFPYTFISPINVPILISQSMFQFLSVDAVLPSSQMIFFFSFIWTRLFGNPSESIFVPRWHSNSPHSFLRSIQPIFREEFNFAAQSIRLVFVIITIISNIIFIILMISSTCTGPCGIHSYTRSSFAQPSGAYFMLWVMIMMMVMMMMMMMMMMMINHLVHNSSYG